MTDPVILLGTQSNGETLPVQVNSFGQLVAEGLQGSEGPEGPEGPEGQEGPPGEPGQPGQPGADGKDGEGVPLPYGEEGSYLGIVDGVPTWNKPDFPVVKEGPFLFTDPLLPPNSDRGPALWLGINTKYEGPDTWDDHIRTLPCWETPDNTVPQGVGVSPRSNVTIKFDLNNKLSDILSIHVIFDGRSGINSGRTYTATVSPVDATNISIIDNSRDFYCPGAVPFLMEFDAKFLLNRENLGERQFELGGFFDGAQGHNGFTVCTSYKFEDSGAFLMNEYMRMKGKIADWDAKMDQLREKLGG